MKNYTIKDLVSLCWKSFVIIIVLALVGGTVMGLVAKKKKHTTYTARRNILITHNLDQFTKNESGNEQPIVSTDLDMMPTYKELVSDSQVLSKARNTLSKKTRKNYSISKIDSAISAKSKDQSLVLTIEAKTDSAKDSVKLANAVSKSFKEELPTLQPGVGYISLLSKAKESNVSSQTSPHTKKYVAVGVALGGLVGMVASFLMFSFSDLKRD